MILTDNGGNKYWVHFWHQKVPAKIIPRSMKEKFFRGSTMSAGNPRAPLIWRIECSVHAGPCPSKERPCKAEVLGYGWTECSLLDEFDPWKGHKIALARAIGTRPNPDGPSMNKLPRDLRTQLWNSYLKQRAVFGEPVRWKEAASQ